MTSKLVVGAAALLVLLLTPLVAFMAMAEPAPPAEPGPAALGDIPADLLPVYRAAAARCALPWEVLAAWGKDASDRSLTSPATLTPAGPLGLLLSARAGQGDFNQAAHAIAVAAGFLCDEGATDPARLPAALAALDPTADVTRILALARIYRTPAPLPNQ